MCLRPSFKKYNNVPPEKISTQYARVQESLKYTVPKVGLFFGVKVPMLLDKNPLRMIKIPCPSSKQPDSRKMAPMTARVRVSSCAAVIPKELA